MKRKKMRYNGFSLENKEDIADLQQALNDTAEKFPIVISFLETYCGYNTAVLSSNPYDISYAGGKRDVILTIKTLLRKDITPEQIVQAFGNRK